MDRISVFGLLIGLLAIIGGQILEGGHIGSLSQPTAMLIVVGGTLGAVMLQSPYATFVRGIRMVRWIWYPPVVNHLQLIQQVSGWSQVSRREGLLALDPIVNELKDEFTRKGLQLVVDGAEPDRLREVMENLSDPSKLGAGIAVAFVATIYGVGLANLVFLPMANKLKAHINRLIVQREMIVDGLVGIANGDNPRIIESRLRGYIF